MRAVAELPRIVGAPAHRLTRAIEATGVRDPRSESHEPGDASAPHLAAVVGAPARGLTSDEAADEAPADDSATEVTEEEAA